MSRYLTKSRFKIALSCPTKLFYTGKTSYANSMADNDFLSMLADGGFQVGELGKILHPGGHEIVSKNNAEALAETAEWMRRDEVELFEPAFAVDGCLVRVDILVKRGMSIEVIEVKAKSFDSNEPGFEGKRGGIASGMERSIRRAACLTSQCFLEIPEGLCGSFCKGVWRAVRHSPRNAH